MKRILIIISVLFAMSVRLSAQQDPQFTHYMYNTLSVNPAYAGSKGVMNITALHRQQWIGLDGAPSTQTISVHSPLRNRKMGVGFSVINDRIGPINQTFLAADYSYSVRFSDKLQLAFGVRAGLDWFQPKIAGLSTIQGGDPSFVGSTMESVMKPNAGAGIYLHHDFWYVGASTPRLIQNKFNLSSSQNDTNSILEVRHLFLIGGFIIPVSQDIKIKPTFQAKMVQNAPVSIDATVEVLFREKFSIGAGMRYGDSFYGMAGYRFSSQFQAGLAFDYSSTQLRSVNNGTVEVMLSYDFLNKQDKLRSPRYF
jgi:type IX secretion system PorP/SprF family membrane protein